MAMNWGAIGLGAGAGLSALGSMTGATSANRAARQARDWYGDRTNEGAERFGSALFGPQGQGAWVDLGIASRDGVGLDQARQNFANATGGGILDQLRAMQGSGAGMLSQRLGDFDRGSMNLDWLANAITRDRAQSWRMGSDALNSAFDQGAAGAMNTQRRATQAVGEYGAGRQANIDRDAERMRQNISGASRARLAASGFGDSTAASDAERGAARESEYMRQDASQQLADAKVDRMTGALNAESGLAALMNAQRSGLASGLFSQAQGELGNLQLQRLQNSYGRQGFRDQANLGDIDRQLGLQQLAPMTQLSAMQGSVMNPWLGQNTSQFYPGYSAAGSGMMNLGNAGAQLGMMDLMRRWGLQNPNEQRQAAQGVANSNLFGMIGGIG